MTKPVTVLNVFAGQNGPIPLAQLDGDMNALAAAINDTATYGNYYVDSGAVNTLVVTVGGSLTFAYGNGVWLDVLVGNTSTISGVTINVNSIGAKAVVDMGGNALVAGAMVAGCVYRLMYDGTSFRQLNQTSISGSFTGTLVGCTTSPTATFTWQRIGNWIFLRCGAGLNATSNATTLSVTGMPAAITSVTGSAIITSVYNNAVLFTSLVNVGGTLFFSDSTGSTSGFTASGTKGIPGNWQLIYQLV
jgi:hypothetical protein